MWSYKTKAGTFWIRPDPKRPGLYQLVINDVWLGSYPSPEDAADNVFMHVTGWNEWEKLIPVASP